MTDFDNGNGWQSVTSSEYGKGFQFVTYFDYGKVAQKQVPESTNSFWERCKLK